MNGTGATSSADWQAVHGAIFVALTAAAACLPVFRTWPLLWLAPLTAYGVLVAVAPPLRATFLRWRLGRFSRRAVAATLILAVGSSSALFAFQFFMRPDLRPYSAFLPVSGFGGVIATGAIFAVVNALLEEIIFRGILFGALEAQWGRWIAAAVTAALFGYGHLRGYPPGPLGAVLAGGYGLALGWLRILTGGLALPVLAHIAADATIFSIVVHSAR